MMKNKKLPVPPKNDPPEMKISVKSPFAKEGLKGNVNLSVSLKKQYQLSLKYALLKP